LQLLQNEEILYSIEGMKRCPLDNTSRIIGKKLTLLILRNMMSNQTKFNQFIESIDGLNPKTLSSRLKGMEKNGLVYRKVYHESPIRIEYYLTEKGKALKSVLDQMAGFSARYCPKTYSRMENPEPCNMQIKAHIGMRMFRIQSSIFMISK
jgi:DNA-binding HxlR family transcriptional regulator